MNRHADLPRRATLGFGFALVMLLATGCGGGGGDAAAPAPAPPPGSPRAVTIASGLDHPWSLAFLPDGRYLVTERAGRLRVVATDGTLSAPVTGLPAVQAAGQGGLLDLALAPDFATSGRIYWSYAEAGSGAEAGRNGTTVARGTLDLATRSVSGVQVIYRQPKVAGSNGHFGGRIALAPDGKLFIALGDRQIDSERGYAQDLSRGNGKIVRINSDGSIPADNPFVAIAGARPEIWSRGHRNPQGAAIDPTSGALWSVEHGPQGGDELNAVAPGRNYGWPLISFGCEYGATPLDSCTPVGGSSAGAGLEQPLAYWVPTSTAPSGMAFYTGSAIPEWRNSLLIGALAGQTLWKIDLAGSGNIVCTPRSGEVANRCAQVDLLRSLNRRIRDVRQGPDGFVYLLTDQGGNADQIIRVQP
ncbi:PQQ-dependent sugar dehydrogenase [Rivibacter subsaxonicus]|uniref:Glucose/arabinose dehydrogenase n=1 Tax=Rivibacter subsaxonicus TaxID=457575 RepID=A0A4Q7W033_9BURK|nr:PQQ-dependent sugar dehydrogenase [Rivibacter subsaxonicus]RZU02521.1 glucose/arabinose dehydrogenase [Rivibacter subsaxonicus]